MKKELEQILKDATPVFDGELNGKKIIFFVINGIEPYELFSDEDVLSEKLRSTRNEIVSLMRNGVSFSENKNVTFYYPEAFLSAKSQANFRGVLKSSDLKEIRIITNSPLFLDGATRGTVAVIKEL